MEHWENCLSVQSVGHTCGGSVVGNEAGHVHGLAVDGQVPHAAHKIPAAHGKVLREVWDASQQQRSCQVQRPAHAQDPTSSPR